MSNKVTFAERDLIADLLLDGLPPQTVATLTDRSLRTVYYVKAEISAGNMTTTYKLKSFWKRMWAAIRGEDVYEESSTRKGGSKGRA